MDVRRCLRNGAESHRTGAVLSEPAAPKPGGGNAWFRWGVAVLLILVVLWVGRHLPIQAGLQGVLERVARAGIWAPLLFVAVYAIATVFLVPGSALTLGAGAVFGLGWGLLWVTVGANLGAQAAFLVGRYLARARVAESMARYPWFSAVDRAVGEEGWKIVGLTRLSPVFPFTLLNYAFGLTRIPFRFYAIATFFGMMPGTVLYVYLGALAHAGIENENRSPAQWAVLLVGLAATLAVTILVTRTARRALGSKLDPNTSR